jgi:hypothetical protein
MRRFMIENILADLSSRPMKRLVVLSLSFCVSSVACSGAEPAAKDSAKTNEAATAKRSADQAKDAATPDPATPDAAANANAKPAESGEPAKPDAVAIEPAAAIPVAAPGEVAINPWASVPHPATWRLVAEPAEALTLVAELDAGVLGRAGTNWYQRGEDGQLAPVTMDVEPKPPVLGVWPSDAWFVDSREREEDDFTYVELRLMKLRGGNRWVPQVYEGGGGEQWFHPGTDHEVAPHMSTLSGMLVYSDELDSITRVAGKHPDPEIGAHRGNVVDFIESGSGNVYVLSVDDGAYYAQIQCGVADPTCLDANAKKLPLSGWTFDRKAARGRHSVSVLARNGERDFILHHRGKSDGWLLDELPAGERPNGMWASEEGGLWTLTGERLRWRDTESVWHDVTLPEGLTTPSVALTEDRTEVWLSGLVGGAAKVFAASANAAPAPAP